MDRHTLNKIEEEFRSATKGFYKFQDAVNDLIVACDSKQTKYLLEYALQLQKLNYTVYDKITSTQMEFDMLSATKMQIR
jgi:hypothetical protein